MTDEQRKGPPPGYLITDVGWNCRSRYNVEPDVPYCSTRTDAIAASWEHADTVFEQHPKTAKLRAANALGWREATRLRDVLDTLTRERDEARAECDALRLEAERMAEAYSSAINERNEAWAEVEELRKRWETCMAVRSDMLKNAGRERDALRAELHRVRNPEPRTGVPDEPCWAWVELELGAVRHPVYWDGYFWEERGGFRCRSEHVSHWWPIARPEFPKEDDDGE